MSDIEVAVRVPADLLVTEAIIGKDGRVFFRYPGSALSDWRDDVIEQIAAAIEARKPKPPKFQVGDVVEWELREVGWCAGIVRRFQVSPHGYLYWCNDDDDYPIVETDLTLVRRAAK